MENCFFAVQLFKFGDCLPAGGDGDRKKGRGRILSPENRDNRFCGRPFAFPVAPPGCLEDGIQPGLLPVDSGEIRIGGQNIAGASRSSLRKKAAIVLQDTVLFSDTVRNNLKYSNEEAIMNCI